MPNVKYVFVDERVCGVVINGILYYDADADSATVYSKATDFYRTVAIPMADVVVLVEAMMLLTVFTAGGA